MTPVQASTVKNEKDVDKNLHDKRQNRVPKFQLGQLVRTANIKKIFSKSDCTKYNYRLFIITEVNNETILSFRINYLPERYIGSLLRPTELTLEQNTQGMNEVNLIQ